MNIPADAYQAAIDAALNEYTDETTFGLAIDKAVEAAARFIAEWALKAEAARWDEDVRTEYGDNIRQSMLMAANEYREDSA